MRGQFFKQEFGMKFMVVLLLGAACSSNPGVLSEKAKELEVYANKPANCNVVGRVVGVDQNGSTELATNDAINQAAKLNASGIFVNQEVPNGKARAVHATAYQCN
jgi:uncharacterized lipoprotein YajG